MNYDEGQNVDLPIAERKKKKKGKDLQLLILHILTKIYRYDGK